MRNSTWPSDVDLMSLKVEFVVLNTQFIVELDYIYKKCYSTDVICGKRSYIRGSTFETSLAKITLNAADLSLSLHTHMANIRVNHRRVNEAHMKAEWASRLDFSASNYQIYIFSRLYSFHQHH